ncbi:hypothetical protein PFB07_21205, partial [Paracoccus sp. AS002]|nr:hypothetical protein [Paracoccus sp. AS002]
MIYRRSSPAASSQTSFGRYFAAVCEALTPDLSLSDPDDRHVPAVAIAGKASMIPTWSPHDAASRETRLNFSGKGDHMEIMADFLTPEKRSALMSKVRGKNTKPEMIVRRSLHAMGVRFRLHAKELPGRPDIVMRRKRCPCHTVMAYFHGRRSSIRLCLWP